MLNIDFKTVVGNSQEAIVVFDRSGTIIYSNKAITNLLGFTSEEIVGRNILTLLQRDSHNLVKSQLRLSAMDEDVQHRYLLDILTKSRNRVACDIVTSALRSTDGGELVMAFVRDMTGMKALEGKYSAEREKYLNLVSESSSIVLVLNKDLIVTLANRGFKERLKYPDHMVVGKDIRDLRIMDSKVVDAIRDIASSSEGEGHRGLESAAWTNDGLKMFVSWYLSAVKEEDGKVSGVLAIGHDITSRFQLEALYRLTSKMLEIEHGISYLTSTVNDSRLMMTSALDLILKMYGHEEGFAMNTASKADQSLIVSVGSKLMHEDITDWTAGRVDEFYEPIYYPEDEVTEEWEQFASGLKSMALLPLRGKEGALGYICIGSERQIALSQNEKDAMVGVISMLGYAYENIGLAESLRKSKEQLSLYNDILLHDITNYLVPMKAYLDLLRRTECGEIKRRDYLDRISSRDAALNEFVQDVKLLMHVNNTKADDLATIPLLTEIGNAIEVSVSRYEGAAVHLLAPNEEDILVRADNALYHLFTNLISNAIKHSLPKPVVVRVVVEAGNMVRISVEDEGPGIPDEKKGLVFERGFSEPTNKVAKSTGIGLSIVSALVEKYHGKVHVEDRVPTKPELGASFVVELQVADDR